MEQLNRKAAVCIFALLVTLAPLLFGAVDTQVQIGITFFLAVGMLILPPVIPRLTPLVTRILVAWAGLMVIKEFAPQAWFGEPRWRMILSQDYGLAFPWTHNPEPGRAVDALLALGIGAIWFIWVRTMAADQKIRVLMTWILFVSAAVFAVVCLVVRSGNPHAIYGIRFTPGWTGYGPFPNRNHTACFLAMGTLLGCGCLASSVRRKKQFPLVAGFIGILLVFVALLESASRGGLVAFAIGLCFFGALILIKQSNRSGLIAVALSVFVFALLFLAFGTKVISRFSTPGEGEISGDLRWAVWANAVSMWKNAPLFGHGLGTFAQVFPLYQTLKLENQIVLHPESSWLLWLTEVGAILLLAAAFGVGLFLAGNVRAAFLKNQGFFLRAGGFAALAVLIFHSVWDVPAHRWAIAGYALAIAAITCPLSSRTAKIDCNWKAALLPFSIAAFWLLPYLVNFPRWSPTCLTALLSRDEGLVSASELGNGLKAFPLNPSLHQSLGMRQLSDYRDTQSAWLQFRIADRLVPSSWPLAAAQAVASTPFSAGMALHFWSLAIERAGHRSEELFSIAYDQTARLPMAAPFWSNYVESNPELLLSYPSHVPDADTRYYFQLWMKERATSNDLKEFEIKNFYDDALRYGSLSDVYAWMSHHPGREALDHKNWASLLHHWNDDATAWKIISRWITEPKFPEGRLSMRREDLEAAWFTDPRNSLNAQMLAQTYIAEGKPEKASEVILAVAAQENSPPWFVQKAAYLQAAAGRYSDAVATLLRE